jgi:hypothetical protein
MKKLFLDEKFRIPERVYVGLMPLEVEIVEDNDYAGQYSPSLQKIIVTKDKGKEFMYSTFIHEILESCNTLFDIGLKEHQIMLLERALCSVELEEKK